MAKKCVLVLLLVLIAISAGCVGQAEPTAEQIKADLIGQRLQVPGSNRYWDFSALSEFEYFDIRGKKTQADVIEYDVSMRLQDLSTNNHFLADALIIYKQIDGQWLLTNIAPKLFKQL